MMRPEQIARLQRLARLRETRARAALGQAVRARAGLESDRARLTEHLRAAAPEPGAADAAHLQAAARLDLLFQQGLEAYHRDRPERDARVARARADYARALGQLRALTGLREQAESAAQRRRESREEEARSTARPDPAPPDGA